MNYLSVEGLGKTAGDKKLFSNISFGLEKGEKAALIANNGAGKSTLMRIIAGLDEPDEGQVTRRRDVRLSFLEQDPVFPEKATVADLIHSEKNEQAEAVKAYEKALEFQETNHGPDAHKLMDEAVHQMDVADAWDYERKVKAMFTRFGITKFDQSVASLSGGQKKRLALSLVLLEEPDILLLDEPTNHLDIEMVEWLEQYLAAANFAVLMVTHDRYFLDRVCDNLLELSEGKMFRHEGNYSRFIQNRAEREEIAGVEAGKVKQLYRQELEWMRKMPKARTTKSKARSDSFYEIEEKNFSSKKKEELTLEVKMSRIGGKILELKKVYKKYGEQQLVKGFDYTFRNGERVGIVGKNGTGKTTFLNLLTGKDHPDSGKINTGDTVVFGYFSQSGPVWKEEKRVIEIVRDIADFIVMADGSKLPASAFLRQFAFPPETHFVPVSKLSGGERKRLFLLTVLIKNPNFLILDEPTNDLDLLTLNVLEEFLLAYKGCLLLVSHDRYFMDKLVDSLFIFRGEGVIDGFTGNYTEFRNKEDNPGKKDKETPNEPVVSRAVQQKPSDVLKKAKPSFKEKSEFEKLEKQISKLEEEKKTLESALNTETPDYSKIMEQTNRLGELLKDLDEKTLRWMELQEKMG